jgi:hypothetical protein
MGLDTLMILRLTFNHEASKALKGTSQACRAVLAATRMSVWFESKDFQCSHSMNVIPVNVVSIQAMMQKSSVD